MAEQYRKFQIDFAHLPEQPMLTLWVRRNFKSNIGTVLVDDIDARIRGAIKKEDFWVVDGDFLAITEVSGTTNKNPKTKEFNDLLGRMATIFKRRDLVPDTSSISGLLILNYDIDTHPLKRPRLYCGGDEEIVKAAQEQSIGLLSTVELYKIAMAVKNGIIKKEEGRNLVKRSGRIEFSPPDPRASDVATAT